MSFSHPDQTHAEDSRELDLVETIAAFGYGQVELEEHDEVPGEWGAWLAGSEPELIGAGDSRIDALRDALAQLETWKANEGRSSHPSSRFE